MSDERDELAWDVFSIDNAAIPDKELRKDFPHEADYAFHIAEGLIEAGYRKTQQVTTVEELDALPVGSVVLSDPYRHHSHGYPVAFQRWDTGNWHRGGRSSDTHPDYIIPATVLHVGARA